MMDCKNDLEAAEGQIDLATENLSRKSLSSARKKNHRGLQQKILLNVIFMQAQD